MESARFFLDIAQNADKPRICSLASAIVDSTLFGMKRGLRKTLVPPSTEEDREVCNSIASIFNEHGMLLERAGDSERARSCFAKAKKWG